MGIGYITAPVSLLLLIISIWYGLQANIADTDEAKRDCFKKGKFWSVGGAVIGLGGGVCSLFF